MPLSRRQIEQDLLKGSRPVGAKLELASHLLLERRAVELQLLGSAQAISAGLDRQKRGDGNGEDD